MTKYFLILVIKSYHGEETVISMIMEGCLSFPGLFIKIRRPKEH